MLKLNLIFLSLILSAPLIYADELNIPLPAAEVSLDPTAVQDQSSLFVSRQVNCQLVRLKQGKVEPEAIESYRYLSPSEIEMTLGRGFLFHDGSSIKALDVVATFDSLRKSRSVLRNVFDWVKSIEATGPNRVVFKLNRAAPHFMKALSAPNHAIFKKAFLESAAKDPSLWKKPMGCGAYRVQEVMPGQIKLTSRVAGPLPIVFHLRAGKPVDASELGKFDIVGFSLLPGNKPPREFRIEKSFDPYHLFLGLNTSLPRWKSKEDRCRYFASLDRKPVMDSYADEAEVAKDLVPRGVIGYVPTVDYVADLKARYGSQQPKFKASCVTFLSVSVPENHREAYVRMMTQAGDKVPESKVIVQPKHFGPQFQSMACDGLVLGLKSNYLDAYEYILLFSEKDANFTGYHNESLKQEIQASQTIEDAGKKAQSYQNILSKIRSECLIYPVATLPMRATWVKNSRVTPEIGEASLNEYSLGEVR